MISPDTLSAIAGIIVALAGLITAVHAHSKSTQANSTADASHGYTKATYDLLMSALTLFGSMRERQAPPTQSPVTVYQQSPPAPVVTVPSATPGQSDAAEYPGVMGELVEWLRTQHQQTTGTAPGGSVVTDFSRVLDQIQLLQRSK